MTIYTIGTGQPYTTLSSLLAAVTLQPGDIVDGGGNTFTEQWTLQLSPTPERIFYQNAVVDVSANATNANALYSNGVGSAHTKNITVKGSGGGAAVLAENTSGLPLVCDFPIIHEDITVVSNYGASDLGDAHDGIDTTGNAQVELRGEVRVSGCRANPPNTSSSQCVSAHSDSKICSFGDTKVYFDDSRMGITTTLNSVVDLSWLDARNLAWNILDHGGDASASNLIRVNGGSLVGKIFGSLSSAHDDAKIEVNNAYVELTFGSSACYTSTFVEFNDCENVFNTTTGQYYPLTGGKIIVNGGSINIVNAPARAFRCEGVVNIAGVNEISSLSGYAGPVIYYNTSNSQSAIDSNVVNVEGKFLQVIAGKQAPKVTRNIFKRTALGGVVYDIDQNGSEAEGLRLQHGNNIYINISDTMQLAAGAITTPLGADCCFNSESTGAAQVITTDPLLTAGNRLGTDSPCLGTGTKIAGITTDIENNPLFPPYNIGPYGLSDGVLGVAPVANDGTPRNNITRLTGTSTIIDPTGTYILDDTNGWRVVTGWTAGTANDFFDADGLPITFTGQQLIDSGVGPRFYCGLKGIAGYTVDQDAAANVKIIRILKVPTYIDTLYWSDSAEMDWSASNE